MPELAGITDIALATGKTKQWINQLRKTRPGSPQSIAELAMGPIFIKPDFLAFVTDPAHAPVPVREWPDRWRVIGRTEIARLLGVGTTRADTVMKKAEAPDPIARLSAGRIWLERPVLAFLAIPGSMSHPRYEVDVPAARLLYEGTGGQPGMDLAPLAAQLMVPHNVLRARLVADGVTLRTADLRKTRIPVTPDEVTSIVLAMEQPGATPYSVGGALGRSPMTIQRIMLTHAGKVDDGQLRPAGGNV
jgi:hypothetical protein